MFAVGISGSTSATSRSRRLVARALLHLRAYGAHTSFIDLAALPAEALLARQRDPAVEDAVVRTAAARIVVIGTPIYRATYSGQLKCFFDLLPPDALAGSVAGLIATGYAESHRLAIDHGLRPLVASLGGLTAALAIYATDAQLPDAGEVPAPIEESADELAAELMCVANARVADGRRRASPLRTRKEQ